MDGLWLWCECAGGKEGGEEETEQGGKREKLKVKSLAACSAQPQRCVHKCGG